MAITIYVPAALRELMEGKSEVEIATPGKTVAEVLATLWERYPGLRDRIVSELGTVREHVNVFVNEENIRYMGGLATPVPDGAEIHIIPAISGGCDLIATSA